MQVVFNKDSSNVGPRDWIRIAEVRPASRQLLLSLRACLIVCVSAMCCALF